MERRELLDQVNSVNVAVVSNGETGNPHSSVPGSCTAVFSIEAVGRKIVLATSTRYQPEEMVQFARGYRWEHIVTVGSAQSSTFKQFLFRRV